MFAAASGPTNPAASNPSMKITTTSLLLILPTVGALCFSGCAHHQSKSTWRIIEDGDPNPNIVDAPARAGTIVRKADTPR
jgi:hypothetical protein